MEIGISSFAFGWAVGTPLQRSPRPFGTGHLLDFAIAQRVPVIQFGDNLPLHVLKDDELDGLAIRARTAGVAIETGARGLTPAHLARYIDISRRLGSRLLRFVIDAKDYEPDLACVARILRDAAPALKAAGITLGIENHDRFPCSTLRRLVDELALEHVGVCLDTANSLGAGEGIGEALAQLAPVCVNLHVKDFSIVRLPYLMGFTVSGRPLGQGMLPLARVLSTVATHRPTATAVIETWPPPETDPHATLAKEESWAIESIHVLRAALQESKTLPFPGTHPNAQP